MWGRGDCRGGNHHHTQRDTPKLTSSSLKLLHININSYRHKATELRQLIEDSKADVISIQETCSNYINIPGFITYYVPYTRGDNRGTALLIKSRIPHHQVQLPVPPPGIEIIAIDIHNQHGRKYRIISSYISQDSLDQDYFTDLLNEEEYTIWLGDFNARHVNLGSPTNNNNGKRLLKLIDDQQLHNANIYNKGTRYDAHRNITSAIDFIIGTQLTTHRLTDFEVLDNIGSDHLPIIATLHTDTVKTAAPFKPRPKFDKADWKTYQAIINEKLTMTPAPQNSKESIDTAIKFLTESIQQASTAAIPTTKPTSRQQLPAAIIAKIREKRTLRRQLHRNRHAVKAAVNRLTRQIKVDIADFRQQQTSDTWDNLKHKTPQQYWNTIRRFMKEPTTYKPTKLIYDNRTYVTAKEQTECFYKLYQDIYSIPPGKPEAQDTTDQVNTYINELLNTNNETITEFPEIVTAEDIITSLKKTKNTSPGEDGIYYSHIKNLPLPALEYFAAILTRCLQLKYFPTIWKIGIVILLPKPQKQHSNPKNHRPITLLPALGKTFERIINSRFKAHLESHMKINPHQSGYREGKSTVDQLTRITIDAARARNQGEVLMAAFFDIEKAFDRMWHQGLLYKMKHLLHISTGLIQLINSFLTDRTVSFRVEDELSQPLTLPVGTPQGSVLSPTLFLLWVNDIPKPSKVNELSQFADDIAIWTKGPFAGHAHDNLQPYSDQIQQWCTKWRIGMNPPKSQVLLTAVKTTDNVYAGHLLVNDTRIDASTTAKFLGITFDDKLSFKQHTDDIIKRVKTRISALQRVTGSATNPRASSRIGKNVYITMIRPLMEYAPTVATMYRESVWTTLHQLQNKALRHALHLHSYASNRIVERLINLPTPKERCFTLAAKYFNNVKRTQQEISLYRKLSNYIPPHLHRTPIGRIRDRLTI